MTTDTINPYFHNRAMRQAGDAIQVMLAAVSREWWVMSFFDISSWPNWPRKLFIVFLPITLSAWLLAIAVIVATALIGALIGLTVLRIASLWRGNL